MVSAWALLRLPPLLPPPLPHRLWQLTDPCTPSAVTHKTFKPLRSSTFQSTDRPIRLLYGSGSMTGLLGYDDLRVSGGGAWRPLPTAYGATCRVSQTHPSPQVPQRLAVCLGETVPG